jgi:hypothetical protein
MADIRERLIPLAEGQPRLDERQITPGQLADMQLGYLSNLGAEVELVTTSSGEVSPVTIAAVGRTFVFGERPDGDRLITQDEMCTSPMWRECDYVTFYTTSQSGDAPTYDYDQLSYAHLGLAPHKDEYYLPLGWYPDPIWYLRWPAEADAHQGTTTS